jgi:hypothetical protein
MLIQKVIMILAFRTTIHTSHRRLNVKFENRLNDMPVERRMAKTKTPNDVPDPGDPERKRVLNVLAQRRYRKR